MDKYLFSHERVYFIVAPKLVVDIRKQFHINPVTSTDSRLYLAVSSITFFAKRITRTILQLNLQHY